MMAMGTRETGPGSRGNARSMLLFGALLAMAAGAGADEGLDVKRSPLRFGGLQEMGMIHKGLLGSTPIMLMEDEWIDHFGSWFEQEVVIEDRLELRGGLGGIFEWPKPEKSGEQYGGSQYKMFYIGPTTAKAMYHFGGMEGKFSLGGGMFPYKYNPDAVDLGEYLLRSQPYPTTIFTGGNGGLTAIGEQYATLQGFHGNFRMGGWSADVLFATETGLPPLYDWSLSFLAGYRSPEGLIDVGAGVQFKRLIQVKSEKTRVEALENSYFKKDGKWYSGNSAYYKNPATFLQGKAREAYAKNRKADSLLGDAYTARAQALLAIADSLQEGGPWLDSTGKVPGAGYYTPAGTMVMARASLDLKKILPYAGHSPSDLRLYAEAAVLGIKDYPVFYRKITQRMPVMAGFNLPTFGLLDLLAVQWEYFDSPNLNNTYTVGENNWSVPYLPEDNLFSRNEWNDLTDKDNYSWSLTARRKVMGALTVSAQVARDHMRTIGTDWFYGARFEPNEVLHKTSSWYWMFQLGWSL